MSFEATCQDSKDKVEIVAMSTRWYFQQGLAKFNSCKWPGDHEISQEK